ncbi:nitric oxide synthase oxygenase [Kitasatospora acidiphila]|uniref:nitric oxide synthase oxygenase n=1 Tax=Kitasatospora acidiphila TaxID=2567942 RepID=UPI0015F0F04F
MSIIDHHFATKQFVRHEEREQKHGRGCPADWSAIVPATSGSTTPVWQRRYEPTRVHPNFAPQPPLWPPGRTTRHATPDSSQTDRSSAPAVATRSGVTTPSGTGPGAPGDRQGSTAPGHRRVASAARRVPPRSWKDGAESGRWLVLNSVVHTGSASAASVEGGGAATGESRAAPPAHSTQAALTGWRMVSSAAPACSARVTTRRACRDGLVPGWVRA